MQTDRGLVIVSGIEKAKEVLSVVQSKLEKFDEVKADVEGDSNLEPDWNLTRNDSQANSIRFVAHLVPLMVRAGKRPSEF